MESCLSNYTSSTLSPEEQTLMIVRDVVRTAAFTTSFLFGLPINCYVLWLLLRGRQERIASDFIPLNQIAAEMLVPCTALWHLLETFLSFCLFYRIHLFSSGMYLTVRPLAQSLICLEQYVATVHPVTFLRYKPLRYKVACCCVSWLTAIIASSIGVTLSLENEVFLAISALYLFFILLMTFCCVSVLTALRRPGPGAGQRDQQKGNRLKKRAFNIILLNLVNTTISQVPIAIISSLRSIIPDVLFTVLGGVHMWTYVVTGFVPPFLYLYRVKMLPRKMCFTIRY